MPECLLWEAFYYSYYINSLDLLCLEYNALFKIQLLSFCRDQMEFFTIAICAIPYQLNWEIIFDFYIVNLNTTMFLFLLYHLSKRDTMPRTTYSKYSESIVTILNVLCSLGLLFRSPELTGVHQLCSFFFLPRKAQANNYSSFFQAHQTNLLPGPKTDL